MTKIAMAEPAHDAPTVVSAKRAAVRVGAVTVPRSATEGTRTLLRAAVEHQLAELEPAAASAGYSVSAALIQLRRYIGPDSDEPRTVCIVDLALHDANGVLVGSVRGRASATMTTREALDAASRSAVSRVPEALRIAARLATPAVEASGVSARR